MDRGRADRHDHDHARLYHSIGMLLPDASILVGGGGASGTTTGPVDQRQRRALLPALSVHGGGPVRAPAAHPPGARHPDHRHELRRAVASPAGVSRVTLIKTGSVTHSFNMEQRFLELAFSSNGGDQLLVSAPGSLNRATPGRYLLFVLDAQGVPSIARIVAVAAAGNPPTLPAFDGLEYIASYPDLIRAFGADRAAGERHYQAFGKAEGRVPNSFNARQYLANYKDLQRAFGTDLQAAARHYITFGCARDAPTRRRPRGIELGAADFCWTPRGSDPPHASPLDHRRRRSDRRAGQGPNLRAGGWLCWLRRGCNSEARSSYSGGIEGRQFTA